LQSLVGGAGRLSVLPAGMRDISSLGVEDEKMTKQELIQAAKEIRDICCQEHSENRA
jgi:hypothetical protein